MDSQPVVAEPTEIGPKPVKPRKRNNLDSEPNQRLLARVREWFGQEWNRQAANRFQMALDEDYYDGMQWADDDAQELLARGQAPLVYNEIKPTIDWLLGTERQQRIDYRVLSREAEYQQEAEVKTSLMKYLSDTNREPRARSRAFKDAVVAGLGWLEVGLRGDPTEEPVFYRYQDWRRILYDSNSNEPDLGDARYVFRWKWLDQDVAEAYFPERAELIRQAVVGRDDNAVDDDEDSFYMGQRVRNPDEDYQSTVGRFVPYDPLAFAHGRRARVRVIECWYRDPAKVQVFRGGPMDGERFDAKNPEHAQYAREGFSLFDNIKMVVKCAIFVDTGLLFAGDSPFDHGRLPLVPVWCFRRKRDNAPYGVVRSIRDPQDDLNKRASKALWLLSANRVTMDEGAVDDIEELRDEVSRPDSVIVKRQGKELRVERDIQLAQQHVDLMERNVEHIRNSSGVTSENLGRQTNAASGKAIIARQEQGSVTAMPIFDSLRESIQIAGELELSLIEQFYDEAKVIRIVGQRGAKYVTINDVDPATGEPMNSITARHASFIVDEQDYRSSVRIAMFESLFNIISNLATTAPMVAMQTLDLLVELADIPNRDEIVKRIRELNGQRDPDEEIPPEEEAAMEQAKAEEQQRQQQMMALSQELMLAKLKAEVADILAKGEKSSAGAILTRVQAMYSSLQAAQVAAGAPGSAPAADQIMAGAGFVDPRQAAQQEAMAQQQAAAEEQGAMMALEEAAAAEEAGVDLSSVLASSTEGMPPPPAGGSPSNAPSAPGVGMMRGIKTPDNDGVR